MIKAIFIDDNTFTNYVCLHKPNPIQKVTVMEIDPKGSNITNIPIGGKWV